MVQNRSNQDLMIFIAGNIRSGTTLLGRILGRNNKVFCFEEMHFFEQFWSANDKGRTLTKDEAVTLVANLLFMEKYGYLGNGSAKSLRKEAANIINGLYQTGNSAAEIYKHFLIWEARNHDKTIPCEHTPRNGFYIGEILDLYPDAKVINIIRDPRDCLFSQKKMWNRGVLSGGKTPPKEVIRYWINYHPITKSKLWSASVGAVEKYRGNNRVYFLRYEDLIQDPENEIRKICNFLEIDFSEDMVNVTQYGSSIQKDSQKIIGVNKNNTGNWRNGGLNSSEIYFCQLINSGLMHKYNYEIENIKPNPFSLTYYMISLPINLLLIIFINLNRMKNIKEAVAKRLPSFLNSAKKGVLSKNE